MQLSLPLAAALLALALPAAHAAPPPAPPAPAQRTALDSTQTATPRRTRLILKDGSYQLVLSYTIKGNVVTYVSAERGGTEEIPLTLVDLDATRKWEQRHAAPADPDSTQAPVIDPELLKEEADRAALTPEVAPNLNLPEQDSVLLLDTFQGTPELVPLAQSDGDLNRNTAHNILKATLNPLAASHQIVQLKGTSAFVQAHVNEPALFLRLGDDSGLSRGGGTPLTVDTHGASANAPTAASGGSPDSRYVIVRTDVRTDSRIVASFKINLLGGVRQQEDVMETTAETLPGGHWLKLTPKHPLDFGEYALLEILSDRQVNLGVWDFGVHPVAPENRDTIKPQPKRRTTLERRRPVPDR